MAANRRRHANAVPLALIATWVLVIGFMGAGGLGYVYLKNEIQMTGTKIKTLERDFEALKTQDEVVRSKIATLSSRTALQKRLNEGFIRMVPVNEERLVKVDFAPTGKDGNELRAVSNEGPVE